MPDFTFHVTGADTVGAALERSHAYIAKQSGPFLSEHTSSVRDYLRANSHRFFRSGGSLLNDTWQSRPIVRKHSTSIKAGWGGKGAAYGYVLERGPATKRQWELKPKGVLSKSYVTKSGKTRNAGDPILALRMMIKGRVVYRKRAKITWSESMLRPHWAPALRATDDAFLRGWGNIVERSFAR